MKLADLDSGRDNNIKLLRLVAALMVVYTHSFYRGDTDPFINFFKVGAGDWGVDIFFFLSGYLICKSWLRKNNLIDFARARILRIYPALWFWNLVHVFVLGGILTTLPYFEHATHPTTLSYLARNSTVILGAQLGLPTVFPSEVTAFNLPLWTLPFELRMYILLALIGMVGLASRAVVSISLAVVGFTLWMLHLAGVALPVDFQMFRFMFFFFAGSAAFLQRANIRLSLPVFLATAAILIASALLTDDAAFMNMIIALCIPYIVLYLAFVPRGAVREFNRVGDYSYGAYIVAFPLQATLVHFWPDMALSVHSMISLAVTLPLAVLSWHLIEEPALRYSHG